MIRKQQILIACVILLLGVVLGGCGGASEAASGSFAGTVADSDAFFALVSGGGQIMAYYCDGRADAPLTLEGWFRGEVTGEEVELTNDRGDTLVGLLSEDSFSGTLTPAGGDAHPVSAAEVSQPAGLYRTDTTIDGETAVGGWIVLPDGQQRGNLNVGGASRGAPALDTSTSTATTGDGKTLTSKWIDPTPDPVRWTDPEPQP
jgi:serine/threonine-protein kinase